MSHTAGGEKASSRIRVGLVGAGPWARRFHAPLLTHGTQIRLTTIWARRPQAAAALAEAHGVSAAVSLEELVGQSEAVVFAVAPEAQAKLAPVAARAGRALLLEKPLAIGLGQAEAMAEEIRSAGVPTMLMLSNRFSSHTQAFLDAAHALDLSGASALMASGTSLPGREFATPWRRGIGALHDVGPHMLDLLDAALGPFESVGAVGDPTRWIAITSCHRNGAVATMSLTLTVEVPEQIFRCEVFGPGGTASTAAHFDHDPMGETAEAIRNRLARMVRTGQSDELDINRGLYLQRWISAAGHSLKSCGKQVAAA
jgi:predicted dehydrogenase